MGVHIPRGKGQFWGRASWAARCKVQERSAVICAKPTEPIEMLFGISTPVGPRQHYLGSARTTWKTPFRRPCTATMRPAVKLVWPLVKFPTRKQSINQSISKFLKCPKWIDHRKDHYRDSANINSMSAALWRIGSRLRAFQWAINEGRGLALTPLNGEGRNPKLEHGVLLRSQSVKTLIWDFDPFHLGELGPTHDLRWWLIGKRV